MKPSIRRGPNAAREDHIAEQLLMGAKGDIRRLG